MQQGSKQLPCLLFTPALSAAPRESAASVTELAPLYKRLISKRAHSTPCCAQECVSQPLPTKSCYAIFCGSPFMHDKAAQREISTRYGLSCGDFLYILRFFFDFDFGALFCFDGCIWSISLQKQVLNLRRAIFRIFRAAAPIRCRRPSLVNRQSPAMREIKWSGSAKRKTSNDTMDVAYSRRQRSKEDSR